MIFNRTQLLNREPVKKYEMEYLATFLRRGENATLLWLPGSDRSSFGIHLQNNKKLLGKYLSARELLGIVFIYVDLDQDFIVIDMTIDTELAKYSKVGKSRDKLAEVVKNVNYVYFVLDNITTKNLPKLEFVHSFDSINSKKINYIYLVKERTFHKFLSSNAKIPTSFFHNTVAIKYFDQKEAFDYIKRYAKKNRVRLSKSEIIAIHNFSGGIPSLIKNSVRLMGKYDDLTRVFSSLEMAGIVKSLWGKFGDKEKEVINKAYLNQPLPAFNTEIKYLHFHRLLGDNHRAQGQWMGLVHKLQS